MAGGLGKGLSITPKVQELSWSTKKKANKNFENTETDEKMDMSESEQIILDSTELIAQKLMEKGSTCLNYISEAELVRLLRLAIRYKFKKKDSGGNMNIDPNIILYPSKTFNIFSDLFV